MNILFKTFRIRYNIVFLVMLICTIFLFANNNILAEDSLNEKILLIKKELNGAKSIVRIRALKKLLAEEEAKLEKIKETPNDVSDAEDSLTTAYIKRLRAGDWDGNQFEMERPICDESMSLNDQYADRMRKGGSSEVEVESCITAEQYNKLTSGELNSNLGSQWLSLRLAKEIFTGAEKVTKLEGSPPAASVTVGGNLAGYIFVTRDMTPSRGFASQIFTIAVGLKLDGSLAGAFILHHDEPIIGLYTPDGELVLPQFAKQYANIDIRQPLRVSLTKTEGEQGIIDGITSATISAVLFNEAIINAARKVALSRGLRLTDEPIIDIVNFYPRSFNDLISDGSVGRLTLTFSDLEKLGLTYQEIIDNATAGVNDLYRYRAVFSGDAPLPKQKEVKRDYIDADPNLLIDVFIAPVTPPTIGRNVLGNKWFDLFVAGRKPGDLTLAIMTLGQYLIDSEPNLVYGPFKRLVILQDGKRYPLLKENYRHLGFVHGEDKPYFVDSGLFNIPKETGIDPLKPWRIELLIESLDKNKQEIFGIDYKLKEQYIIKPDGIVLADTNVPAWVEAWKMQEKNIFILSITLLVIFISLWKLSELSKYPNFYFIFRTAFLAWVLVWMGWISGAQLTILNILTWITSLKNGLQASVILSDPLITLLSGVTILTFFLWGRGVFCGWLCPFGAMQELLGKAAQAIKIPQLKINHTWHKRLWPIKYFIFMGMLITAFYSMQWANWASEVEPFKTAISLRFERSWPFVVYALILLIMGLFVERFFCRFICPLGAFLAIGGKLRMRNPLLRRKECGSPCQLCTVRCPIGAIEPDGKIKMEECFYCLDCQIIYQDEHVCPPLVKLNKIKVDNSKALAK